MLQDGILLADGSVADNLQIQHGTTLPVTGNNVGELYYKTSAPAGLYVYDGGQWVQQNTGSGGSSTFTVTGDVTGTLDGGTDVLTLATIPDVAGSYGSSSQTLQLTVDGKGRITQIGQPLIYMNETQINPGSLLARNADNETITGDWTFSGTASGQTPTVDANFATKGYVDAVAGGLDPKDACYVASTANIASLSGLLTIDGVTLNVGDRVLVKNQSTASQNGIYVAASGAWTRASDFDGSPSTEVSSGAYTFISHGTANAATGWVLTTTNPITIGTTALSFSQLSAAPTTAAAGTLTGTTLNPTVVTSSLTSVGTLGSLTVTGTATAGTFSGAHSGSGASLTSLNASNLSSGTVSPARLGSGTADSTTYLRGDNTWQTISTGAPSLTSGQIGFGSGSNVLTGDAGLTYVIHTDPSPNYWHAQVLSLNGAAAYDQSFLLGNDLGGNTGNYNRVGLTFHGSASGSAYASTGDTTLQFAGTFRISASGGGAGGQPLPIVTVNSATQTLTVQNLAGAGAAITALSASNLSTGTVPVARIGSSGTASSSTFLRGDNTWATPTATADAGTLTGTTLASGVTGSSLTSVGTLARLLVANGTSAAPSITFAADSGTDTGFNHTGEGEIQIITNGTNVAQITSASLVFNGTSGFSGVGTSLTALNASNLGSGTVPTARLGSGTANSTTYLRGDNTWQTITSGASLSTANTWTALQTFNGPGAGTFAVGFGAAYTEKQNAPTLAATFPIDCSLGNNFTVALGATAITALNFTNVPTTGTNYSATLYVTQDSTGGRSMSLSTVQVGGVAKTIKWAGGTAPTITSGANKIDIFTFVTYDGGNTWLGFIAGQNY
jgi:hypothetical protein